MNNDYLILVLKQDQESGTMHIFLNNTLLCEAGKETGYVYEPENISYQLNKDKTAISKIFQQVK